MKDIILDSTWDLSTSNGDFKIDKSDNQNVIFVTYIDKGQMIGDLDLGAGATSLVNSSTTQIQRFNSILAEELNKDSYTLESLEYIDNNLNIEVK
jgi:hypothetical protein